MSDKIKEYTDLLDLGTKLSRLGVMTYDIDTIAYGCYYCSVDEFISRNSFTKCDISSEHKDFIFFLTDVILKYDENVKLIPSGFLYFNNDSEIVFFFYDKKNKLYAMMLNDTGYFLDLVNSRREDPIFHKYFIHRHALGNIRKHSVKIDLGLLLETLSDEDRFLEVFNMICDDIFKYLYFFSNQELDYIFKRILFSIALYSEGFIFHIKSKYYKDRFYLGNTLGKFASYKFNVVYDNNAKVKNVVSNSILNHSAIVLLKMGINLVYNVVRDGFKVNVFPKTVKVKSTYSIYIDKMKIISINNDDYPNVDKINDLYLHFRVFRRQGTWEKMYLYRVNKFISEWRFILKAGLYDLFSKVEIGEDYDIIYNSNIPNAYKTVVYKISKILKFDLNKVVDCFTKLQKQDAKDRRMKKKK